MAKRMALALKRRPTGQVAKLPATMRTAAIDGAGGPDVVTIHVQPVPLPGPTQVLVAVHTSGLAGWDADMREGWSPGGGRRRYPFVLGTDGSGTVAAVGSRVRRFRVGDRVYGSSFETAGFHAQYVAVSADLLAHVPPGLELKHAGAIPLTATTALQGIEDALQLERGESVIIHGAAGGVGSLAIQFAKMHRAVVLASATGDDGMALVRRLGADLAVDGRRDDIVARARELAPEGIDAVLGLAGGGALERCMDALRPGGRVAYPHGVEPAPKKRRGVDVIGFDGSFEARELVRLNRAIRAAKLRVPIGGTYALADAARAHERLARGHVLGKIVLRIG